MLCPDGSFLDYENQWDSFGSCVSVFRDCRSYLFPYKLDARNNPLRNKSECVAKCPRPLAPTKGIT